MQSTTAGAAAASASKKKTVQSSAPAGTKLTGLNVKKSGEDPVALAEEEYPEWLWDLLDPSIQKQKLEQDPDLLAKKERRAANRKHIKSQNFMSKM
jgi:large subunit ribosomal protein L54